MSALSERPPNYLSSRSADVILSDIRPTSLKTEALRSVNVFLDELLWLLISSARSFATDRLKAALLKLLPTPLGKDALLEAEVELRAYLERTSSTAFVDAATDSEGFALKPAFELLRLKCEAYSTLNDSDEDSEAEARWQAKATNADGSPLNGSHVAPAALYLTAILEAVSEHILLNTGRVIARDSSRNAANVQDLFTAMCEDDGVYAMFKTMKVHDQLDNQIKLAANKQPRRSKSSQRGEHMRGFSSGAAHLDPPEVIPPPRSSSRMSTDSNTSSAPHHAQAASLNSTNSRSSLDKSKVKKMFGRTSSDRSAPLPTPDSSTGHKRSDSVMTDGRKSTQSVPEDKRNGVAYPQEESPTTQQFDDLMRSDTTMKMSLTPDRLRTFEVYNKGKALRVNKVPVPPFALPASDAAQPSPATPLNGPVSASGQPVEVNSAETTIAENERNPSPVPDRKRVKSISSKGSFKATPPSSYFPPPPIPPEAMSPAAAARPRSVSTSVTNPPNPRRPVARKSSLNAFNHGPAEQPQQQASPPRPLATRKPVHRNRESMDLDELMDGLSEEEPLKKSIFLPKSARPSDMGTRDLIDFLKEGPPEPIPMQPPPTSPKTPKQRSFFRVVSKLARGGSSDKLADDPFSPRRSMNPPPSLSSKRSMKSLAPSLLTPVKPTPPPLHTLISPPATPPQPAPQPHVSPQLPAQPIILERPRPPKPRKVAPSWEEKAEIKENEIAPKRAEAPPKPSPVIPVAKPERKTSPPRPAVTLEKVGNPNRQSPTPRSAADSLPTPQPSAQTIASVAQSSSSQSSPNVPFATPPTTPAHPFAAHLEDMQRLMARASTADECRLILDMFLAQSGISIQNSRVDSPVSVEKPPLEHQSSVVEVLLGHDSEAREAYPASPEQPIAELPKERNSYNAIPTIQPVAALA